MGVTRKIHEERGKKREGKGRGGRGERERESGEADAFLLVSLILSALKRHSNRLEHCNVKSILNLPAAN